MSESRRAALILLCLTCLSACGHRQSMRSIGAAQARYTVGAPWQSNGYWFYPAEEASYEATGLAVVDPANPRLDHRTADGEPYDPNVASGAHQTLQLPVVLRVRNLENGRGILLRINDRGPFSPGRILSVTPRAAALLEMTPGQPAGVRITEDEALTERLFRHVEGAPPADVTAAPVAAIQERSLMPAAAGSIQAAHEAAFQQTQLRDDPEPTSESVTQTSPEAGAMWIDAGHFSTAAYARRLAAELGGITRQDGAGRSAIFSVRVGPFTIVGQADAALDRARAAGVTGARIIVE